MPREVEDVLYEHPAVRGAAVVGQPDEYRGEIVVPLASMKSGTSATKQELVALAKERLAACKYPRGVHIIGDLPKKQMGSSAAASCVTTTKQPVFNLGAKGKS